VYLFVALEVEHPCRCFNDRATWDETLGYQWKGC